MVSSQNGPTDTVAPSATTDPLVEKTPQEPPNNQPPTSISPDREMKPTNEPTPKTLAPTPQIKITSTTQTNPTHKTQLNNTTILMSKAFATDSALRFMLSPAFKDEKARHSYLRKWLEVVFKSGSLNGAIFEEVNNFSAAAVWMPPKSKSDSFWTYLDPRIGVPAMFFKLGIKCFRRMLGDFQKKSEEVKLRGLGKEVVERGEFWYLWFIGTLPECRGQGLSSAMIRKYQEIARNDDLPIWLEATSEQSKRVYAKLGFEVFEEFRVGKGYVADDGSDAKDGPGVLVTCMIWRPQSKDLSG